MNLENFILSQLRILGAVGIGIAFLQVNENLFLYCYALFYSA